MKATGEEAPAALDGSNIVPLESILCTGELNRRPSRPPDYEAENRALAALVQALADSPGTILQKLADTILEVLKTHSAGLSLVTKDGKRFYWPAIAGAWKPHAGGGTERDFGPCGDVLDRDAPLLFRNFERRYPYLPQAAPPATEALFVPFYVNGKAAGTIWAMAHDDRRRFDAEDLRQMESLGRFAAAAYQAAELSPVQDSRRAALNLMEDAVRSSQAMETANRKLSESERRFREMIDALPAAVYTTDAEGRLTHFNPAAVEFSGRVPELGTDRWCVSWKLYHADGTPMPLDECFMAIAIKEGRILRGVEAIIERPDGTRRWFEPYPTPLRDDEGRLAGGINMLVDITARRGAAEAQARLAAIVESSSDAIVGKDLDGIIRSWNGGAERIFGYTAEEVIGKQVPIIMAPGQKDEMLAIMARISRGERVDHFETQRVAKDGRTIQVSLSVSPIADSAGRVVGASKVARDITERRRTEEELRESAERLRFMAESMPQKIFTATPAGDVDYFNAQWMDFTGLTFEQIRDWGWTQFTHPDDVAENVRVWQHSIDTGEPFQFVHRFQRADGEYRWHLSRAQAMRDANGGISMWIGSNTDIHDAKKTEEALLQSQRELRSRNEDLKHFAFAASHDLREPLRMVMSYTQLLAREYKGRLDPKADQFIAYAVDGARRMDSLLRDLREFWSVNESEIEKLGPVDCNRVLERALAFLESPIRESGTVVTHDPLPTVIAEELPPVLLFQNLIGNALKYRRPDAPPRIHVSAQEDGGAWRITVADNGIGIEPEYQQIVFAPFKRLHGGEVPGTGMGLAICQKIVERYGGRIWVESTYGQGSAFHFTLPAK